MIFRIQRLLELQAQSCKEITASLRENKPYHFNKRVERALLGTLHSFELYKAQHLNDQDELIDIQTLLDNLQSINWQLRQLAQETTVTEQLAQIHTEQITGLRNISAVIFSHLLLSRRCSVMQYVYLLWYFYVVQLLSFSNLILVIGFY